MIRAPLGAGKTTLLREWMNLLGQCSVSPEVFVVPSGISPDTFTQLENDLVAAHLRYLNNHDNRGIRRDVIVTIDGWEPADDEHLAAWLADQLAAHPWLAAVITTRANTALESDLSLLGGTLNIITPGLLRFTAAESAQLFENVTGTAPLHGSRFSGLPFLTLREAQHHTADRPPHPADPRPLAMNLLQTSLAQLTEESTRRALIALCSLQTLEAAALSSHSGQKTVRELESLGVAYQLTDQQRLVLCEDFELVGTGRLPGVSRAEQCSALRWYARLCMRSGCWCSAFEAYVSAGDLDQASKLIFKTHPAQIVLGLDRVGDSLSTLTPKQFMRHPVLCVLYASWLLRVPGQQRQAGALLNLALYGDSKAFVETSSTEDALGQLLWHHTRMNAQRLGVIEGDALAESELIKRVIRTHRTELMQTRYALMLEFLERAAETELVRGKPALAVETIANEVPPMRIDAAEADEYGLRKVILAAAYMMLGQRTSAERLALSPEDLMVRGFNAETHAHVSLSVLYQVSACLEDQQYGQAKELLQRYSQGLESYDAVHLLAHAQANTAICLQRAREGLIDLRELHTRLAADRVVDRYALASMILAEANLTLAIGQIGEAQRMVQAVSRDLDRLDSGLFLARCALARQNYARTRTVLAGLPMPKPLDVRRRATVGLISGIVEIGEQATNRAAPLVKNAAHLLSEAQLTMPLVHLDSHSRALLDSFCSASSDVYLRSWGAQVRSLPAQIVVKGRGLEHEVLSERERVVLNELIESSGPSGIAAQLSVSVNTVKSQLKSLYRKLDAHNRTEALEEAVRRGLVDLPADYIEPVES